MAVRTNSIGMIHGVLWGKILKCSLVYKDKAFLRHLYSVADMMVVDRFAGEQALEIVITQVFTAGAILAILCGEVLRRVVDFCVMHILLYPF